MIKKFFLPLTLVLALVVMAYGMNGTGAWFTDEARLEGSTISTGKLDLATSGIPMTISGLEPGIEVDAGYFCIENSGNLNMKFRGKLYGTNDPNGMKQYLTVRLEFSDLPDVNYGPADGSEFLPATAFSELEVAENTYLDMDEGTYPFMPGHKICYDVFVGMNTNAPNSVQDSTLTTNLYIEGTQYINTDW